MLNGTSAFQRDAFEQMLLIRTFEEAILRMERDGAVIGPVHVSFGQEAVAVGTCCVLERGDVITSTHRGHHHCIAKGASIEQMFAELMGRTTGWARGRGGSMHIIDRSVGIIGTNGIVGAGLPIAVGAAYKFAVKQEPNVVVCFFGEGAANTGNFGEALNMAGLWSLPVVFICENNQFVELASYKVHTSGNIHERARGYNLPGVSVDGNDVVQVRLAVGEAVSRARRGEGPTLIEAVTFRWMGHYSGDAGTYMDSDEVNRWKTEHDPLLSAGASLSPEERQAIRDHVADLVDEALRLALQAPQTTHETLFIDGDW